MLPQNCGVLQLGGCPPACEHCRENSDSVLQTQKSFEEFLQPHMSCTHVWMYSSGLISLVQELQESESNICSHFVCYMGKIVGFEF